MGDTEAPGCECLLSVATDSPLSGANAAMYPSPVTFWMVPGFSDHRSSVGVADEDCRSVLRCKSSLGNRYVVLQRYCRILDNADTAAVSPEDLVDTLPARAVHKGTYKGVETALPDLAEAQHKAVRALAYGLHISPYVI